MRWFGSCRALVRHGLLVDENDVDGLAGPITQMMVGAAELEVPLVVDVGVGDNWDEAH